MTWGQEVEVHGPMSAVDVVLGVSGRAVRTAEAGLRRTRRIAGPLAGAALRPALVPPTWQPAHWLARAAEDGAVERTLLVRALSRRLDVLVPVLAEAVLRRTPVTELLRRYVDLDELLTGVDLDAAVGRVDLDRVVQGVDVDAVVSRVDLDEAARRLDLEAVLDRIDLTSAVVSRVDLDVVVRAVLDRLDLIALAEEVIDGVDLPEIIRESTGTMASDTVQGVRMQGIVADEAVGRAVDRLLLRRGRRSTEAPAAGSSETAGDEPGVPKQREPGT